MAAIGQRLESGCLFVEQHELTPQQRAEEDLSIAFQTAQRVNDHNAVVSGRTLEVLESSIDRLAHDYFQGFDVDVYTDPHMGAIALLTALSESPDEYVAQNAAEVNMIVERMIERGDGAGFVDQLKGNLWAAAGCPEGLDDDFGGKALRSDTFTVTREALGRAVIMQIQSSESDSMQAVVARAFVSVASFAARRLEGRNAQEEIREVEAAVDTHFERREPAGRFEPLFQLKDETHDQPRRELATQINDMLHRGMRFHYAVPDRQESMAVLGTRILQERIQGEQGHFRYAPQESAKERYLRENTSVFAPLLERQHWARIADLPVVEVEAAEEDNVPGYGLFD